MDKKIRKKMSAVIDIILLIGTPVLLILVWEYLSQIEVIPKSAMPAPSKIISKFVTVVQNGSLQEDILVSAGRVVKGFILGASAGIVFGVLIALFRKIDKATTILVAVLRPIPIIALLPLLILWFGIDERSKVAIICLGSFWPVLLNTIQGIKQSDQKLVEVAQVLKLSRWKTVIRIIIPSAFPYIFTGIRLAVGGALACVVTAEMVAASEGIGYMIMYARMMAQPDALMVGVIVLGVVGLVIEFGMLKLQKSLFKY